MNSIYRKIFLFAIILFFSGMMISTVLNIRETRIILNNEKISQAETLLRSLLEKCKYAITIIDNKSMETYIDRKSLDDFVQDILRNEPEVIEVLLVNRNGIILSSADGSRKNQLLPPLLFENRRIESGEIAYTHDEKSHSLRMLGDIKINGVSWGTALIDLSMIPLERRVNHLTHQALWTGIIFLLLGVVLLIPLVRTIVKPIQQLSRFAEEIGNGNLNQKIEIATSDEIGQLALAFSTMVAKLKQTRETLEKRMADLHHSENQLKKSEKKYRHIFENAMEGMFQILLDGTIISANPAIIEMLGYNSFNEIDDHLGNQVIQLFSDSSDGKALLKTIYEKKQVTDYETRFVQKDKKVITVAISVRGIFDSNKQLVMLEGFVLDIMEKKQKEAAERESAAAKAASDAKSTFLATMSHDIRTPLNAVTGFSELLLSLVTDEKQKSYLTAIQSSGKSLLLFINDILDLSKIEAGKLEIRYSPTDIRDLLKEVEQIFALQAKNKDIQFIVDVSNKLPPTLFLDELRLRQILLNLVGNAIKFTDQGSISLSVYALKKTDNSMFDVHISVQDTGIGVSKKDMDAIFDSFKQPTGQDSSRYGGTGLGLAICKRLVRLMNGSINAESIEGKGSTFKIIIKDVLSGAKEVQVIKEQIYHEDVKFKSGIALVVDDVDSNRQILKELLNKMNLDVLEAQNGQEAIVISLECQPDIIFMDIRMPVMDGFEAVRQLKIDQKIYKTPVIGVTASSSGLIPSTIMEKGFNGFLAKPIEADKLLAELLKHLPVTKTDEHKKVSEKREITDEWKTLSGKTLSRLPELIRILNSEYMDQWQEFAKRQPIEEVKKFGKDLKDLGREFEINPLVDYGKSLLVDIDNFDVATMQITINNFLLLRSKIEALIEENL